jgi:hypothetical protein
MIDNLISIVNDLPDPLKMVIGIALGMLIGLLLFADPTRRWW